MRNFEDVQFNWGVLTKDQLVLSSASLTLAFEKCSDVFASLIFASVSLRWPD